VSFLDLFPDLRSAIHDALDKMLNLPLAALQAEFDNVFDFISGLQAQIDSINLDLLGFDLLISDLNAALSLEGILPGECIQIDLILLNLQAIAAFFAALLNPLVKGLQFVLDRLALLSSLIGSINSMIANALGLFC
jgi:hypothetical protein